MGTKPAAVQETAGEEEAEVVVRQTALRAATNVPSRRRTRVRAAASAASFFSPGAWKRSAFHALPEYLKDNEYILHWHRPTLPWRESAKSLFFLHSETGNIWTHLLGFLFFVALTTLVMSRPPVPLAFGQPQLDTLWGRIQGKVSAVQEQLQHRLHHLEAGVQGQLHSMQQGLSHTAQELGHGLQGLQHGLSASAHAWTEHLHAAVDEALGPHAPQWPTQRWPAYVFLGGAMACLLISATCHLFGCCAAHISKYLWRVDYSGITILIVTSFYPPVYYGFMCQPALRNFYLASTTLMGAATIAVSLPDRFQQRAYRPLRAGMYASLGMWGVAPVLHAWLLHGHAWQMRWALLYDLAMGAMYLLGAFLYAARIPECWHPGKYDLWFHSHQLFHIAVVIAAYIHYRAVLLLLEWRDASGGCALPVTGSVQQLLQELQQQGASLLHVDAAWIREQMRQYAQQHFGFSLAL